MKTTIDLPDELVEQVRRIAREEGVTMRELMIEGLHGEIERRREAVPRVDFVFASVPGRGLRPEVGDRQLTDLAYDLESRAR